MEKTLEEKIAVMQHCFNGGKVIVNGELWTLREPPNFNWGIIDYDIYVEPKTKPSINWEHVSKEFNYMATDEDGKTHIYKDKPFLARTKDLFYSCIGEYLSTSSFASFQQGTCDWKDSLVSRFDNQE